MQLSVFKFQSEEEQMLNHKYEAQKPTVIDLNSIK